MAKLLKMPKPALLSPADKAMMAGALRKLAEQVEADEIGPVCYVCVTSDGADVDMAYAGVNVDVYRLCGALDALKQQLLHEWHVSRFESE